MENPVPDTSAPSESSKTGTAACPDSTGISWGMDKNGRAGRGVSVGVGVDVEGGRETGRRIVPPLVRPIIGAPRGSEKEADGSSENRTCTASPTNLARHPTPRVISTTTPSDIDDNRPVPPTVVSTMTMSISPSVSPTSWENTTLNSGGTVKRTASGKPSSSESVRSRLVQDSG